jgi:hypothetical protein
MKLHWILPLLTGWFAASALAMAETNTAPNSPASTNTPTAATPRRFDYDAFKTVAERNIFNGNRSGQRVVSRSVAQRVTKVDSFTLVGTMNSEKGDLAFFDGSDSEFRKAIKLNQRVGEFEVHEIWPAGVKLRQGTNEFALRVGTALRREDEGNWHYSDAGSYSSSAGSWSSRSRDNGSSRSESRGGGSANPESSTSTSAPPLPAAEVNEVLRKLMEKREKE